MRLKAIFFIVVVFSTIIRGQIFSDKVKVGSGGISFEKGYGSEGTHLGIALEYRYIGGILAGAVNNYPLFSGYQANLVKDKHYVSGLRIGFGWVNHKNASDYWLQTEENLWLSTEEVNYGRFSLELLWGYELYPQESVNPFITTGINFGSNFYDMTPSDTTTGNVNDFSMILPLTIGCDIRFYEGLIPDKKGVIDGWALTPYVKLDIPICNPEYELTKQPYTSGDINTFNEKFSEWWGIATIGVSLTFQFLVYPSTQQHDSDHDGIPDESDDCFDTPRNVVVDDRGCPVSDSRGKTKFNIVRELEDKGKVDFYIYFAYDNAVIPTEFFSDLDDLGDALVNEHLDWNLEIAGHTDSLASASYNQKLSERRANSVRDYLFDHYAINKSRLIAKGYGESQPKADNGTEDGRALNRRVEFIIIERSKNN